jgi:hypothetical protein
MSKSGLSTESFPTSWVLSSFRPTTSGDRSSAFRSGTEISMPQKTRLPGSEKNHKYLGRVSCDGDIRRPSTRIKSAKLTRLR